MPKRCCRVLQKDVLSVASDCTGLNAAAMALESLSLPFQEEWVSDSDVAVRSVLQRNFAPKTLLSSVQEDVPNHLPVDFYSAGYPCQPFSVLGNCDGLESEDGKVLLYVLQRIRKKRPRTFLLENVKKFQKFTKAYELARDVLKALKDLALDTRGKPYYKLQAKVLNSLHHGVAQSRGRLYSVGVHDLVRDFRWPEPQAPVSLESALDPQDGSGPEWPRSKTEIRNLITCYKKLQDKGQSMRCNGIADIGMSSKWCQSSTPFSVGYAPCLTKSRCESNGYWAFSRQRKLHLTAYFRLQGICPQRLQCREDVTEAKMRAMVGNSFTVPMIAKIMDRLFSVQGSQVSL
eukprot:s2915_g2.t1